MALVCRDGSIHSSFQGGRRYVERELCYAILCVMLRGRIIGSSVFHPGQRVTQSLQGGEAVQAAMNESQIIGRVFDGTTFLSDPCTLGFWCKWY